MTPKECCVTLELGVITRIYNLHDEESIESILTDILSPVQWVLAQYLHACVPITLLVDKYLIYVERSVYQKFHAITYLAVLLMEEELSLEDKH
ncbi:hypothetical protein Ciccas_014385 [Cichlidogyrus casuarinus]|uniref:Uncharacterized protein n=1 Tax=Cichlidogyrus casuarinus TaxID=1844966 RepID=A0ABD2PIF7_9PLAT